MGTFYSGNVASKYNGLTYPLEAYVPTLAGDTAVNLGDYAVILNGANSRVAQPVHYNGLGEIGDYMLVTDPRITNRQVGDARYLLNKGINSGELSPSPEKTESKQIGGSMNYSQYLAGGGATNLKAAIMLQVKQAMAQDKPGTVKKLLEMGLEGQLILQELAQEDPEVAQIAEELMTQTMKCGGKVRAKVRKHACGGKSKKPAKKEEGGEVVEAKCGGKAKKKVKKAEAGAPVTISNEKKSITFGAKGTCIPCQKKLMRVGGKIVETGCDDVISHKEGSRIAYAQDGVDTSYWIKTTPKTSWNPNANRHETHNVLDINWKRIFSTPLDNTRYVYNNDRGAKTGYGIDEDGELYWFDRDGRSNNPINMSHLEDLYGRDNNFRKWADSLLWANPQDFLRIKDNFVAKRRVATVGQKLQVSPAPAFQGDLITPQVKAPILGIDLEASAGNKSAVQVLPEAPASEKEAVVETPNTELLAPQMTAGQRMFKNAGFANLAAMNRDERKEWLTTGAGKDIQGLGFDVSTYTGSPELNRALLAAMLAKLAASAAGTQEVKLLTPVYTAGRINQKTGAVNTGWAGISDQDLLNYKGSLFDLSNEELARQRELKRNPNSAIANGTVRNGDAMYQNGTWVDMTDLSQNLGKTLPGMNPWSARPSNFTFDPSSVMNLRFKQGGLLSYSQYLN